MMSGQEKYDWMVYVSCLTFNHAPYIEDAMNGFTMQETNFPFVCVIIDDASTDGEQFVVKKYLEKHFDIYDKKIVRQEETDDYVLTFARHKTNLNCHFAVYNLKYNHYSIKKSRIPYISEWRNKAKYVAMCEGDDFWVSSNKLQRQYELMEAHPNYSMCCHNAIKLFVENKIARTFNEGIKEGDLPAETIIKRWSIPTASMFYRKEYDAYPAWLVQIYSGDMALYLRCLAGGDIYYFDDILSVYRYNTGGDSSSARMKGKELFIMEQQNILLESFNKGTGGKFNKEISDTINHNNRLIRYERKKQKGIIYCLFEMHFYRKIASKIKRFLS